VLARLCDERRLPSGRDLQRHDGHLYLTAKAIRLTFRAPRLGCRLSCVGPRARWACVSWKTEGNLDA
jgi:hypothetical protein